MNAAEQTPLVAWLKAGGPWGAPPEVIETHAAYVFLTGERAYKLKKAVDLGYLDFASVAKRKAALERELTLNARTAPRFYLRVLPVTRAGVGFALAGGGEIVDHLLEMKRFPADALLSARADQGRLDAAAIEDLVRHVVAFHAREAPRTGADWPAMIRRIADENARDLHAQTQTFDARILDQYLARRDAAMVRHAARLAHQSAAVRHCHGDMHLANAFLDDGRPTLFDCIEFDEFYALMPPLYDVAFLLMDLRARGLTTLANRALNAWLIAQEPSAWEEAAADLALLPLYLALRAEVRAKTEGRKPGGRDNARRYLQLAAAMIEPAPPRLVAIGGLSGTGKSTLARALAPELGALHLRTDELRKRLAGVALDARLPADSYTPEASDSVYAALERLVRAALHADQTVIADGVFAAPAERASVERITAETHARFDGLWLEAPTATLTERLARRKGDASDADAAVLAKQLAYDLGEIAWRRLDASAGLDAALEAARAALH